MVDTLIAIALNAAFLAIVYIIFRNRIRKALDSGEIAGRIRDEVGHMVVEINQTTDRNIRLLEERIEHLQDLLAKADKKIQLISREYQKYEVGLDVYDKLKKASRTPEAPIERSEPAGPAPAGEQNLSSNVMALYRQGFDPKIIAGRVGTTLGEVELIISLRGERGTE